MDLDPERYGLQPGDDRQDRATPSQCLDWAYWASVLAASSHERREAKAAPEAGYSRADESIDIHGVHTPLDGIDADLARALVTAGANFSAATTNLEQPEQRQVISFLVDAVLRRHQFLTAKVKERLAVERA
jgi:glutathione S-transferase